MNRTRRGTIVTILLLLALLAAIIMGCLMGQVDASLQDIGRTLLSVWGIRPDTGDTSITVARTLWEVRFPRVLLALAVGAGLGCAGALLQGVFANPLAEPGIIGVSSGAAVCAAGLLTILHLSGVDPSTMMLQWGSAAAAFVGALLTTLLVYALSRVGGKIVIVNFILVGVAVNACALGIITFLSFVGGVAAQSQVVFWQLGSCAAASWSKALTALAITLVGVVAALLMSRKMDLLALGEAQAQHLGVNVERFRVLVVIVLAALVGVGVAFAGAIAFVGLVVPHALRILIGPQHKWLIPTSAIGGAVVLLLCDTVARTLISTAELPIGMLTSLIGGPVFLLLLRRYKSVGTGWN